MTKVFGAGSPEWNEGRGSQIAPRPTRPHGRLRRPTSSDTRSTAARAAASATPTPRTPAPDPLPDEQGGYTGFKGLFGAKYVNPAITGGSAYVKDTNGNPIADPFNQCGFPGFDGLTANVTLAMTAQMQEAGVPVTYAYISDARDNHGKSGNIHIAYGPGEPGYVQQLKDYDKAFGDFFTRLNKDGITKDNTLFVFTVEEGDHFAGSTPTRPAATASPRRVHDLRSRDRGQRRREADGRDVQRDPPGEQRDHELQRSLRHGTERVHHRQPGTGFGDCPHARADARGYLGDEPTAREHGKAVRGDGRPGRGAVAPHGHRRSGADSDIHAVRAGRLLPQRLVDDAVRRKQPGQLRLHPEHDGVDADVRLGTTAGSSPRSPRRGWDGSGRASRRASQATTFWSDHADLRPTMLMLLGLKDTYVSDGRVLTDFLDTNALPVSLRQHSPTASRTSAPAYQQIVASFGQFSQDTLQASTDALASSFGG